MNLVEDPRAGGEVRRYHTWAVHHQQTVAEHTWQIMRIMLTIWPNAHRNVIVWALVHDMGEMAGDIQYPFKLLFTQLGEGSEKAEAHVRARMNEKLGAPYITHPLSKFEKTVFKLCDNLEMWEFGMREVNMGNLYAKIIVQRMAGAVAANLSALESLQGTTEYLRNDGIVAAVHRYMATRTEMENI
jgi:5'-deoxynucleotidase YfbR-like HD superfamily hydrolase